MFGPQFLKSKPMTGHRDWRSELRVYSIWSHSMEVAKETLKVDESSV